MTTFPEDSAPAPDVLLAEMGDLRSRVRADRRAFWFPLMVFGVIEVCSAPLYVHRLQWLVDSRIADLLLLAATAAGLALTVWWYRRRALAVGVSTSTRGPVLAIAGTSAFLVVSSVSLPLLLVFGILLFRGTGWLIAVAAGLLALAWAERSALLAVIAGLHAVATGLGVLYNPENIVYRMLGFFGVADQDMPFDYGATVNVLLPGVVLLAGGLLTVARRRARAA